MKLLRNTCENVIDNPNEESSSIELLFYPLNIGFYHCEMPTITFHRRGKAKNLIWDIVYIDSIYPYPVPIGASKFTFMRFPPND